MRKTIALLLALLAGPALADGHGVLPPQDSELEQWYQDKWTDPATVKYVFCWSIRMVSVAGDGTETEMPLRTPGCWHQLEYPTFAAAALGANEIEQMIILFYAQQVAASGDRRMQMLLERKGLGGP